MQPISVEAFASMVMKNNKGYRKKELVKTLNETLTAKKNGAKCMICGAPIWAAGSAITGSNLCFTCTTGEANDSDDYEIELCLELGMYSRTASSYEDLICQNLFQTHQLISLKDSPTNKSAVRLKNYQDIQKYINLNFSRQQQISGAS